MKKRTSSTSQSHAVFKRSKLAIAIATQLFASHAWAAPSGGEVVRGSGNIEQNGSATTITQNSDRLAIDWRNFDIGKNERVEFIQPGQSAVALNRILGNKGTEILGRIDANGHVILVNPRGVVFGESATINVGGLVASGLQINPDDFMNGDLVFKRIEGSDGTVINSGMINAASGGNVVLLGTQVENRGLISANLGSAILASGKEAVLTFDESGLLGVQVNEAILQQELGEGFAVSNSGEIRAENGRVLLSAATTRDVFSQAVNWGEQQQARSVTYNEDGSFTLGAGGDVINSGTIIASGENGAGDIVVLGENITNRGAIRADAVSGRAGNIELHSNITTKVEGSGVVTANAEKGGDIKVLGKNVGLFDQAKIESIGNNGGGQVLFGGDREGLNSEIRNADFAYIGENTSIDVSATNNGDGGKAIILAEDSARIYGSLAARGGETGGNGGFIETSGKRGFEINRAPDISAVEGLAGHWLIDPYDITINDDLHRNVPEENPFVSQKNGAILNYRILESALNQGGVVTVQTGESADNTEEGNITVARSINVAPSKEATLNLIAHNDIIINAGVQASGVHSLHLNLHANKSENPESKGSIEFARNSSESVTIRTNGGDFKIGYINEDGIIDTGRSGAYNVDFSRSIIDVTAPTYNDADFNRYFAGRTSSIGDRRQYLSNSGRIVVNASNDVNLGGTTGGGVSHNGDVTMIVRGRERDVSDDYAKIYIKAGNNISLDAGRIWSYDNNPTEVLESGQNAHDGFTTLKLDAKNIDLKGNILSAWSEETGDNRQDQNDRLMIDLTAAENISITGSIHTSGGDFTATANNVSFANLNTGSRYGAGNVKVTATGEVDLGDMPMFAEMVSGVDANPLRTPGLEVKADVLNLGSDIYTRGGDILLEASRLNLNARRLETRNSGNIELATASDLDLSDIVSAGDITLKSIGSNDAFVITSTGDFQLDGVLTLDLNQGSANLSNVVNNATDDSANVIITSAANVSYQTSGTIRLGDSVVTGDLTLAGSDITQQAETHLEVAGSSVFSVNNGSIILNHLDNIFTGAIWIEGDGAAEIASSKSLVLGRANETMEFDGTLVLRSGEDIAQASAWSVEGEATLDAAGNITLTEDNALTSLAITRAVEADIHNSQNLNLGDIQNVDTLKLNISGSVTQSEGAEVIVDNLELSLGGSDKITLTNDGNQIQTISGGVGAGHISTNGPLSIGNLIVNGNDDFAISAVGENANVSQASGSILQILSNAAISASEVTLSETIHISNGASLEFNDVKHFVLSATLQGDAGAGEETLTVNGSGEDDLFEVLTSANWDELVAITLKGGEGNDTLVGPNINAQWIFDDSYQLQTESIALTFSSMEKIQGGTQDDRFIFAKGSIPNLTLLGGDGDDVADYSATQDNIRVSLGDIAGLQEIELIRGNNDGTSAYNSALVGGEGEHTWTIKQTNTGEVQTEDGNIIVFEHFNQLVGGEGTDRFILDADLVGANAQIDGGNGDDIFDVNVDFTADILGGNGADRFNLNAATSGFVLGGDGDDIFALTENSRVAVLNGGDGNDELLGFNADLSWYIDAGVVAGATVVKVSDEDTDYVKSATNITTLKGNDGDDTFWFSLNNSGVGVDGGKGTNTADFSKVLADLVVNLGNLQQSGINNVGAIVGNANTTYSSALEDTGSGGAHWQISAENSGTYTLNDDVVTFSGFNQLIGGSGNDTFELAANLTGKNARVAGGDGNNQYIFKSAFSANIAGGADNDDFVLHEDALLTGTLDGGEGSNSLALYDADFVWTIDETAGGQIKVTAAEKSAEDSILVVMEAINLTALKGGAGDDTFQYSLNNSGIAADGGDGFNTADFSRVQGELQVSVSSTDVFGVTNISRIVGNGENATLLGSDNNNSWIWNSTGGVITWGSEKIEFSGFDHWIGGGGKDNFVLHTLNNAPASIQGGNGEDSLDLGAIESNVEIALGGALNISGLDLSFSGIETVRANENYSNHLISGANQSLWNIDGVNQGSLTVEDNFTIHFENFQNLTGLHGNTFNVTDNGQLVGGSVTGGDQESRLVVTGAADNTWKISGPSLGVLTRGDSTVLSFTQVSVLHGGSGRDQFELTDEAASVSSIDGRGGINTLKANWNSAAPLVWNIDNGKGELVGHIAQFLNISELVGQAGKDQFDIRGNTTLNVIDSGAGDDIINLFDNSRVDSIFAGAGADTIAISGSATVPSIDGGEGDDRLDLANYGTALTWNIANNQIGNFQYINVERVIAPAGGGLINTIQGPDEATKWIITGENAGRFETDKGTFFFQYISQLLGGSADDTFELAGGSITGSIDGGGGNNALHGSSSDAQWSLNGANSGSLSNPEGGVVLFQNIQNLIGGNGTDEFTIGENGLLTGELRGGGGRDTLISNRAQQAWKLNDEELPSLLSLAGTDIVKFFEVESLVGSGSDQLFGGTLDHNWVINGVNSGNYSIVGQAGSIEFSGIESLTGGAGADHFTVTPNGSIGKFIDGGDGDNSLVVERNGDVVVNLDPTKSIQNAVTALRVQEITANGSGQRRLYGSSQHDDGYIWIIDGENTGTVTPEKTNEQIRFVNFDYLFGGDRSDSFRINTNASVLRIDGGGDTDFVDHSAHEGDLDITIGESLIPGSAFSISNIEGLIGNGGVGSSYKATLRAQGGENTWTIKGVNDGSYSQRNGTSMEFRDFNHLVGGSGNDEFVLREAGLITGSIRDLGGNNTLNLSAINSGRSLKAVVFAGTDAPASRSETLYVQGLQTINGAGSATTLVGPNVRTEWTLNPQGQSTLSYGQNNNTRVTFSNFAHVTGGSAVDIFSINAANPLAGWLSGGGGADQINFAGTQSVSVWLADNTNTVPANGLWHKLLTDIETIEAQQLAQNILRRQSNANQTWSITGSDTGLISGVTFRGFGQLHGSEKDDDFVFSADGRLSGGIDGFGGVNTVDLTNITESVTVALGMPENDNRTNVDLRISRIRSVNANTNESLENRLWAADQKNEWKIRDKNSGDLNLNLTFSGFANLIGGADDDKFSFASTGKITGQIDGGDHIAGDVVDYSSIEDPLVIDLRGTSDLINIEDMVGNRATTLYGPDELARWEIEGVNQGELSYSMPTDQKLRFISVNRIVGGNTSDEFIFSAGSVITGGVDGGEGNDAFSITLGRTADTLSTLLSGGAGSDSLKFLGSDSGWRATYGPGSKGDAEFSFIAPETDKPALRVAYDGMDQVQVQSSLDQVVLNGREDADQFRLGKETWQWGSLVAVSYQEGLVRSLVVNGDNADTITISGNITLPESLHLHGGSVVAENGNARVATDKLRLDSVQLVGSTDSPLRISANELAITNNQGSLYLIEENGLTLTDLTGTGKVNLTLTSGNLLQSKEINSDADLEIFARSGAARLNHENNRLGGAVGVEAATDARLRTSGNLRLSRVTASNLDLHAGGNISSAGVINVANLTRLNSGGNITLTQENNLNQVIIEAANNVRLTNNTALSVMGANARDLQLTASQIAFQGKVDASSLIANSVNELSISDVITTNGNVSMTSSAGSFEMLEGGQINSSNGNISITSKENQTLQVLKAATGNIALTSENGQISLLNNVETVALDVKSSSDLYVAGLISTFTDATFTSGDKFEMSEQGKIESSNGNISIFSQGSQTLGALSAKGGEIDLESATSEITINGPVLANTLSANGATKIAIQGAIKATGDTKFISGNEFEMGGQGFIESKGGNIVIATEGVQRLNALSAMSGDVSLTSAAGSISFYGKTEGDTLSVNGVTKVSVFGRIETKGDAVVTSNGGFEMGAPGTISSETGNISITANNVVMDDSAQIESKKGNIAIATEGLQRLGILSAVEGDISLESTANLIQLNGNVAANTLSANGAAALSINGLVNVLGDVSLTSQGGLLMGELSEINSAAGNIEITTEGSQFLGKLTAEQGDVFLRSGGSIADSNGNADNIIANTLFARSVTGIGTSVDWLDLAVGQIDAVNERNGVYLSNKGTLVVERIHNSGDIYLANTQDVKFLKESVNAFHGAEEAQYPPSNKLDKPEYGGHFYIGIETGNILTDGSLLLTEPHIAARTVEIFNPHGAFVPPSPVIYAPDEVRITSGRSRNRPYWGMATPARIIDDTKYYGDVVGAGERLIEVEGLAEFDAAIFTQVKNYFYQDVSIRLPSDQIYEEEE